MDKFSKPLLVTGAAGFIGFRFVEQCTLRMIPVIAVDMQSNFADRTEHRGLNVEKIIDRNALAKELQKPLNLSGIVHLGACTDTTETNELDLKKWNLEYSQFLWSYACRYSIPFVYASSAATYGDGSLGYDDDESLLPRLKPLNPYGWSKQWFDTWVLDESKKGHHPPEWSGFKFFNVYGYGERHKAKMASVVLQAFDQINQSGRVRLFRSHHPDFGDGYQIRDFIAIEDVVKVLFFALEKPLLSGIYNLGTGKGRTFLDLISIVFHELNKKVDIDFIDTPKEIRSQYQYFTEAHIEKLRNIGYTKNFLSIEEGTHLYMERLKKNT